MTEISHKDFGSFNSQKEEEIKKEMPKDDLQSLIELGCIVDKKTIGDKVFELRSLNSSETIEIGKKATENPTPEESFEINAFILAKAIKSVNGKPLESYYTGEIKNDEQCFKVKMNIIKSMQLNVINKLLSFYNDINKRSNSEFDSEQVKN